MLFVPIPIVPAVPTLNEVPSCELRYSLVKFSSMYSLKSNPGDLKKPFLYPAGGYINKLPKDPWGNDYVYVFPTNNGSYQIISLGADGQPGGEGESKDITNTP